MEKENKNIKKYAIMIIISILMLLIGILIGRNSISSNADLETSKELRPIIKAFCDIEKDMSVEDVKKVLNSVGGEVEYKSFANFGVDKYKDEEFYAVNVNDERLRVDFKSGKVWVKTYTLNTSKGMYADESKVYYKEHNPNDGNYENSIKLFENSKDIMKNSSENDIEEETIFLFN